MRILVAEDDEALGKFVRKGLETEHHSVDVFPDGEQARSAASESDYDLVILDLNLPKSRRCERFTSIAAEETQPARSCANTAYKGRGPGRVPRHRSRRLPG